MQYLEDFFKYNPIEPQIWTLCYSNELFISSDEVVKYIETLDAKHGYILWKALTTLAHDYVLLEHFVISFAEDAFEHFYEIPEKYRKYELETNSEKA